MTRWRLKAAREQSRHRSVAALLAAHAMIPLLIAAILLPPPLAAEVAPVTLRVPQQQAWIGQRVAVFVELRAKGPFAGAITFDLPQIPRTMMIKIGNPVVGSEDLEGHSWFVQTHEFALFSQTPGQLSVPAFKVRYASRASFTGPPLDAEAEVPAWTLELRRPPDSEQIGFLVTSESVEVEESWERPSDPLEVGAIIKRTIVQRARGVPGMALAPASTTAPEGVRVYGGEAQTNDQLERGEFLGERRETLTYLLQQPGTLTLPELSYVWWNPQTETLESTILPAVSFEVSAAPTSPNQDPAIGHQTWTWLLAAGVIAAAGIAWRRRLVAALQRGWLTINPPYRVAARDLRRACRAHDASAAAAAWATWRNTQDNGHPATRELCSAVLELQRHVFGPAALPAWRGEALARAFDANLTAMKMDSARASACDLPSLNFREKESSSTAKHH